ncbi:MAG: guanylate kinase [Deltaproteobacteria bacterium]|nr:guanylate kinase [Deltaproteobacteria bacterium]
MRIFISGPSGVGKSSVIKEILKRKPDTVLSVSYTTRAPRPGEHDGTDYFFVSRDTFEEMIEKGSFLEWANVHGHLYGTSLAWVESREADGFNVLFDIDVQGVIQAKAQGSKGCFIFLVPPDMEELSRRLNGRGTEDTRQLALRLENARHELTYWTIYDYLVVNDSLEKTIEDVSTIMEAQGLLKEEVIRKLPWLSTIA